MAETIFNQGSNEENGKLRKQKTKKTESQQNRKPRKQKTKKTENQENRNEKTRKSFKKRRSKDPFLMP